ncbi:unnamed protein product, partial [Scytosiphon promiscuus]
VDAKAASAKAKADARRDEILLADAEFALGRFVFLVPPKSKKCDRPILVGKIVDRMPEDDESDAGEGGGG